MRKFAHILNPVAVKPASDLYIAQPVTFESMRIARDEAKGTCDVELFSAQYQEDSDIVPGYFQMTPNLERSLLDMGNIQGAKKLPLLHDILERLYKASEAEFFIYTNVDIAVQPHFYTEVSKIIDQGIDAMVINRRTISDQHTHVSNLPIMYKESGQPHYGYDCFVFRRASYPNFDLGNACIGAMAIGSLLLINIACFSNNFKEFRDLHLTFHIGNSEVWRDIALQAMQVFNQKEFYAAQMRLAPRFNLEKLPEVGQKPLRDYFAWIRQQNARGWQ